MLLIVLLAALVLAARGRRCRAAYAALRDGVRHDARRRRGDGRRSLAGRTGECRLRGRPGRLPARRRGAGRSGRRHGDPPYRQAGASSTARLLTAEPGTHASVWVGGPLRVLVDAVPGGGFQLTFGPPAGTVDVDLDLDGVLTNPPGPGQATWRAVVTTGAGTVEARSVVGIPQTLGFRARFAGRLVLRGRLLSARAPRHGVDVHFAIATNDDLSEARDLGTARDARGRHVFAHAVVSAQANATAPDADRLRQLLRGPVPRLRRAIDHPTARRVRVADSPEALKRPGTGVRLQRDDPPKHSPNRASVAFMLVPLSTEEEAAR